MKRLQNGRRGERGVALAETAIMISFTLLMLFSMMQFSLLGYFQVAGDAATFFAAHEYTLGVTQPTIAGIETQMVPAPIASAVTFIPSPPPSVDPSIFNTIYGGTIDQANRSGGYTLVRPQNFQVALNSATYNGVFGFSNVPISAGAVEGYYLMTSQQMDNAGVGPNDPYSVGSGVLNAPDASPFLPQSDASIYNMNTPPYYLPSPTMIMCSTPWTNPTQNFGNLCNNGAREPWYLGLGEYLSNYNYGQSTMDVNQGGAFQAMAIHQRVYADLITAFPPVVALTAQLKDTVLQTIAKQFAQNYNGTTLPCNTPNSCGAMFNPATNVLVPGAPLAFANGGVPLYAYDPLNYWETQTAYTKPQWNPGRMWGNETAAYGALLGADPGNDGPEGPAAWKGASFALVYYWDQPNYPPHPTAPGSYPTHPLAGGQAAGDPAY